MIGLFLDPAILCLLLYLFARHNAEFDFLRVFFITLGIGVGGAVIFMALAPSIGLLSLIPVFLLALFLLMKFCYVSLKQGVIILSVFVILKIILNYAFLSAFSHG